MSVNLFFGLPGCGKTTLMTANVIKDIQSGKYDMVVGNVDLNINGYTKIDNECIGFYLICNAAIHIDEGTLFADNRDYKSFPKEQIKYFLEHRHFNVDIFIYTQQWDGIDRKIRVITDRVYYVFKGVFLGRWITSYYRIPYGIIIPDPNKKGASGEKLGEIIQGYCKPNLFVRIFSRKIFRPNYYEYFNSWERYELDPLPEKYKPYYDLKYEQYGKLFDLEYYLECLLEKVILIEIKLRRRFFKNDIV